MRQPSARELRAVVFELDNTLLRSSIGARRGLLIAAELISAELKKNGHLYGQRNLFKQLQLIDHEMLRRKYLYNRDVWWGTLLHKLVVGTRFAGIHRVTVRYWEADVTNSPPCL